VSAIASELTSRAEAAKREPEEIEELDMEFDSRLYSELPRPRFMRTTG
jgi:hypothetical protein